MNVIPSSLRRRFALCCALAVATTASAQTAEGYRISVTRKTEAQRKGDVRRLPFRPAKVRPVSTDTFFSVEIRRMRPDMPENATVEALIAIQSPNGRLIPGGYTREMVALPLGISTTLETDSVSLQSVEWRGRGRADGEFGPQIYGVAIRILDADGKVLSERIQPKALESEVNRLIEDWNKTLEKPEPPPPRPRQWPPVRR